MTSSVSVMSSPSLDSRAPPQQAHPTGPGTSTRSRGRWSNAADGFEQPAISAVAASQGERLEQARDTVILDRTIVAAGFVAEGASNPAFAKPGCSGNEQVLRPPGVQRAAGR